MAEDGTQEGWLTTDAEHQQAEQPDHHPEQLSITTFAEQGLHWMLLACPSMYMAARHVPAGEWSEIRELPILLLINSSAFARGAPVRKVKTAFFSGDTIRALLMMTSEKVRSEKQRKEAKDGVVVSRERRII